MAVDPEIGNVYGVAVLQDEYQQEQQDDGEAADGDPQAAGPGPLKLVLGRLALQRNVSFLRGRRSLSFGSGLGRGARYVTCGAGHLLVLEILRRIRHYLAPPFSLMRVLPSMKKVTHLVITKTGGFRFGGRLALRGRK
jgi:hypothetical protein